MFESMKNIGRKAAKFISTRSFLGVVLALVTTLTLLTSAASVNTVTITDGDQIKTIKTYHTDADMILADAGFELSEDDAILSAGLDTKTGTITVQRAFDVHVTYGNEKMTAKIATGTVADVLEKLGIQSDEHDIISAELTDTVSAGMFIDIISVDYDTTTKEEPIQPGVDTVYSDALYEGQSETKEGIPGVKQVTYKNKLVNGTVTETTAVSETVVKEAVNAVKTVGTKPQMAGTTTVVNTSKPTKGSKWYSSLSTVSTLQPDTDFELDDNNVPVSYSRLITGKGTAYFETGLTATGKRCRPGYVAVNPRQIPYGSKLYVKTPDGSYIYGYCSAEDTGGFVSWGTIAIDLFFPSEGACNTFGVRNVEIYVLN